MPTGPSHTRVVAVASLVALLVACTAGPDDVAGIAPRAPRAAVSAASISVAVLPTPAGSVITAKGVSAAGYIVGGAGSTSTTPAQPFAWTRPYDANPVLMGPEGYAEGLDGPNDAGDATASTANGPGFWARGDAGWTFVPLTVPGTVYSVVVAGVNNARQFAGWGWEGGVQKALWWGAPDSTAVALPAPPVTGTLKSYRSMALDNFGNVVGEVQETFPTRNKQTTTRVHAVLWQRGAAGWAVVVLPDVGTENRAYDINDAGQIVGNATNSGAVLWSPSATGYTATVVSTSQASLTRIDRCGRIIGSTTASVHTAYIVDGGVTTTLPAPTGSTGTDVNGITTDLTTGEGVIVGRSLQSGNNPALPVRWTLPGCP